MSDTEGVVYYNGVEWFSATVSSFESLHIGDNDADLILVGFAGSGEVLMALSLNDECPSDPTVYMLESTDDFDPSVHSEGKFSSFLKRLVLE